MTPFDFVNSITHNKKDLFAEEPEQSEKDYAPFIVNKALALYPDCLFYANEMNRLHHLDADLQFRYYLNSIRPMKRYAKWVKRMDDDNLDVVKRYYGYNNKKAKQALSILSSSELNTIKQIIKKGG
jgi:hypothetical protein